MKQNMWLELGSILMNIWGLFPMTLFTILITKVVLVARSLSHRFTSLISFVKKSSLSTIEKSISWCTSISIKSWGKTKLKDIMKEVLAWHHIKSNKKKTKKNTIFLKKDPPDKILKNSHIALFLSLLTNLLKSWVPKKFIRSYWDKK